MSAKVNCRLLANATLEEKRNVTVNNQANTNDARAKSEATVATSGSELDRLEKAFSAEAFRVQGKQIVDQLADYLLALQSSERSENVLNHVLPNDSFAKWQASLERPVGEDPQWWDQLIGDTIHLHHPRYMGHQICPPAPIAALAGLFADFLNNGMGVYEMGEGPTSIERVVVDWVARQFGMPDTAGGFLTSGGTIGNLTAMLSARRAFQGDDVWNAGVGQRLAILVSDQAHYCIDRAARVMGLGAAGVVKVPVNERFKMKTHLLEQMWQQQVEQGITPIAVVGSACSTSTGSYDDLNAIADFCESKGIWFHVDGAHGASACLSPRYEQLVSGIERANSVVMDFHKTMMTPALATALVYRNYQDAYKTFSQEADYLWGSADSEEWYQLTKRTFECTKNMMAVKVFSILKTHGTELFTDYIDRCFGLGKTFARLIDQHGQFEIATQPECNIVCFRYIEAGRSAEEIDTINTSIRESLLQAGNFYIVQTVLKGRRYLRTTLTNPFTLESDLTALLEESVDLARRTRE